MTEALRMNSSYLHTDAGQYAAASCSASVWRRQVARSFSRTAERYTQLAHAQQRMGEVLWPLLPSRARRVLDLGCGPGHWSRRLAARFGQECRVTGLDLASGMLETARRATPVNVAWLCADAAALPLTDAQLDLVFSNLAIQWCPDLNGVMQELHRVLRPGGRVLINTLGPGTLGEIARVWATPHTLIAFRSSDQYLASAHRAGFIDAHCAAITERFFYPDLAAVMDSIKGVGAQATPVPTRLTRSGLMRVKQRYEVLREPEGLPLSYQRLTLVLNKELQP